MNHKLNSIRGLLILVTFLLGLIHWALLDLAETIQAYLVILTVQVVNMLIALCLTFPCFDKISWLNERIM